MSNRGYAASFGKPWEEPGVRRRREIERDIQIAGVRRTLTGVDDAIIRERLSLLPPAASLTPEDRLQALAGLPDSVIDEKGTSTMLEVGRLCVYPNLRCHYISGSQIGRDLTYDARGRDHQREGVLRQWLGTPCVEGA